LFSPALSTRFQQPVHALGAQLVDGPQLMQRPQVPEPQPVRAGDIRRPGKRALRLLQVALPRDPADHFQGLAGHLRLPVGLGGPQRGPGQLVGLGEVSPAGRDLRRAGIGLRRVGPRAPAGDFDAGRGLRPPRAGDRRPRDSQVQGRRPGRLTPAAQPGEQRLARLDRPLDLTGHRQDLGQRLIDRGAQHDVIRAGQGAGP
jgi:hypothetical protein